MTFTWEGLTVGWCVVQRVDDRAVVLEADPIIEVSRALLAEAASDGLPGVSVDGPLLNLCGTHVYRDMDRLGPSGEPLYELTTSPAEATP